MLKSIPIGTSVWFLRLGDVVPYPATITSVHPFYQSDSHHYVIDCPLYPYVIGYAGDEEVFSDEVILNKEINERQTQKRNARKFELAKIIKEAKKELRSLRTLSPVI